MSTRIFGVVGGLALCTSMASAEIILETASGFEINGTEIHSSTIEIGAEHGAPLENLSIQVNLVGLQHTWVGDLVVTLTHVDSGNTVSLFGGVGGGAFGSPAQFDGAYSFSDAYYDPGDPTVRSLWQAADDAGSDVIPSLPFYASANGSSAYVSMNAAFAGDLSSGAWRLDIEDTYPSLDDGTPVPAPGAVALLGLAGLAGSRRRN
jgi:MYXO-CTERM domain-containing protein